MPIEVTGLNYSYKKGTPFEKKVLYDVHLRINDGEVVGIIGPTQSGKTTLAQHFNALFIPQSGKVIVNGINTAYKKADLVKLRHEVGYVFQNPDYQLFASCVGEDIAFGPRNQGLPSEDVAARVKEAMSQVGLDYDTFYSRDIFALSGGQKRRTAIAGVLACKPKTLVLDDITAGLDPRGRDEILAVVKRLHSEKQITIIYISNSMDEIAELAERVIVIDQGRIAFDDLKINVFNQPEKLRDIGLELPELMTLAIDLHQQGFNIDPALLKFDEILQSILDSLQEGQVRE